MFSETLVVTLERFKIEYLKQTFFASGPPVVAGTLCSEAARVQGFQSCAITVASRTGMHVDV